MNRRHFLRASAAAALATFLQRRIAGADIRTDANSGATLSIIPQPAQITTTSGSFRLSAATQLGANAADYAVTEGFAAYLRPATGYALAVLDASAGDGIFLRTDPALTQLGDEGYRLTVASDRIDITALSATGLFYGSQTLRQLLPPAIFGSVPVNDVPWDIPCVTIEDQPRFRWRGLMLDSGHDFQPLETVRRYVDLMAIHKFNVFHWHLTDLGSWPLEIKAYPQLTDSSTRGNGVKEGFYTQDDVRDIVRYASERHITVVPEIDVPGHVMPVLKAYPDFNCPLPPTRFIGQFCLGNEDLYPFIEAIFSEVCDLFPSAFIHIGGDECDLNRWNKCPRCQAFREQNGLADSKAMQGYFTGWLAKFLDSKGRRVIGWDEIIAAPLPTNAAVMSWHGTGGGIAAVKAGHEVVMTPTDPCYFDYGPNPQQMGKVYQFDPATGLDPAQTQMVLGSEGEMWTDKHPSSDEIDRHVYPRALALAETLWSPREAKNFQNFSGRLPAGLARLDQLGVHYFRG
jgi:hexosaminidase